MTQRHRPTRHGQPSASRWPQPATALAWCTLASLVLPGCGGGGEGDPAVTDAPSPLAAPAPVPAASSAATAADADVSTVLAVANAGVAAEAMALAAQRSLQDEANLAGADGKRAGQRRRDGTGPCAGTGTSASRHAPGGASAPRWQAAWAPRWWCG